MKVNRWLVLLLMLTGLGVGAVSLYMASLSGVMGKMGLVGGDFRDSIRANELARLILAHKGSANCSVWQTTKSVPGYLYAKGEEKVVLSRELGGLRIMCGVRQVQGGNVERGVYTLMKGLYYLRAHYVELRILVQADRNKCELLDEPEYESWIEGYLMATEGRVHELVLQVYKQVQIERGAVEELCSD